MAAPVRKYNPGFLTDDELVASFCVRTAEFEMLVETLRECTGASNPHQIVIGPRGSGKTSLLLRVAAEARRDAALAALCFPVVFAEESYEVATAGEFWLECLTQLAARAAPYREDEPDLDRTVGELRAVRDDRVLGDRCLGALLDFADRRGRRLLLIVENLNTLFRDVADPDAGWRLRKVLQTEPRIILFASATSRFDEIDRPDRALYDMFRVRTLRPLDTKQCAVLWEAVAGRPAARETVRSLEILTGGSPRLIAIVARFGAGRSFRELMADLLDLGRRPHGVLQEPPGIASRAGTPRLSRARRAVEAGHDAGSRGPRPARAQPVQRPARAPPRARRGPGSRRQRPAQTVLPDRAPVQRLLPAAPPKRTRPSGRSPRPLHGVVLFANGVEGHLRSHGQRGRRDGRGGPIVAPDRARTVDGIARPGRGSC